MGELDDAVFHLEDWVTSVSAPLQEIIEDRNYHVRRDREAAARDRKDAKRFQFWMLLLGGLVAACGVGLQVATFYLTVRGAR